MRRQTKAGSCPCFSWGITGEADGWASRPYQRLIREHPCESVANKTIGVTYDAIDQLIGADYYTNAVIERAVSYDYDPVGNRTNVTENGAPTGYSANKLNQYTEVGGYAVTHDANGNLVSDGVPNGWAYTYDAQNRMVSAQGWQLPRRMDCGYDARNRCVWRTINGVTRYFVWDGWSLIEERDTTGNVLARYYHGATVDELLARVTPTGTVYYHHDALGSAVALTDGTGSVVESYRYDVYGAVTVYDTNGTTLASSAYGNRFAFTGREYLAELGLYDYRNRMYSQTLGRFLQIDPIRFDAQDVNLYRYVGNCPALFEDPYGLDWRLRYSAEVRGRCVPNKDGTDCGGDLKKSESGTRNYTAKPSEGQIDSFLESVIANLRSAAIAGCKSRNACCDFVETGASSSYDLEEVKPPAP
jgi:RHS repeat-associated protein